MSVRMRALQSFSGLEGRVRRGQSFSTTETRALHLEGHNPNGVVLARRLLAPDGVGPTRAAVTGPTETKPASEAEEPNHVGGGWYEWRGHRYRGKAAAEAAKRG